MQGFRIESIAGSSMGALVGGVYAAGKLDQYRNWVGSMQKYEMWRMLDWTLTGGGFIEGDRIMGALRDLVGETSIEDLSIPYAAVAVDIHTQREVWLSAARCSTRSGLRSRPRPSFAHIATAAACWSTAGCSTRCPYQRRCAT